MTKPTPAYGCEGCVYFEGVVYLGDIQYVNCPKLLDECGGRRADIKTWRGCGLRVPKNPPGGRVQQMLF